jgi:hypothetical protein
MGQEGGLRPGRCWTFWSATKSRYWLTRWAGWVLSITVQVSLLDGIGHREAVRESCAFEDIGDLDVDLSTFQAPNSVLFNSSSTPRIPFRLAKHDWTSAANPGDAVPSSASVACD